MLLNLLFLAASVAPAIAVVTSGLYRIASNYFLLDVISQDGGDIYLDPIEQGRLEQLWSVVVTNGTATIQNVGTKAFLSVAADEYHSIVPNDTLHQWTFNPDTLSAVGIVSGGQAVLGDFEGAALILANGGGAAALWNFLPTVPQPHAYRVWNQATNLYLDQVQGDCDYFFDYCVLASAFNATSESQVWNVAGTSFCGGRLTLQNAASGAFLASGPDFTPTGTKAVFDSAPYPWRYGFVGGKLTINDKDFNELITTLTVSRGTADLYTWQDGPGTRMLLKSRQDFLTSLKHNVFKTGR